MRNTKKPHLGFGLGLRTEHYESILSDHPPIDWFEIITENYLIPGGKPHYYLEKICERYPVVMHGVSMPIGSTDPLDWDYVDQVKTLSEKIKPKVALKPQIFDLAYSPDGKLVALAGFQDVRLLDPATKQVVAELKGEGKEYDRLDPQVQLRMLTENIPHNLKPGWYPFDDAIGRVGQGYSKDLREARNEWAHMKSSIADQARGAAREFDKVGD